MRVNVGAGWLALLSEVGGGWDRKTVVVGRGLECNGKSGGVHRAGSGGEDVCRAAHRRAW